MELQMYERENLARLRSGLAGCTVLLKQDGAFPLEKPGTLALYGCGARHTVKGGTGSGEVNSRFFVTAEQGLREAGFTITTDEWLDAYDAIRAKAEDAFLRTLRERAKKKHTMAILEGIGAVMPEPEYALPLGAMADAAVYVLSRISGEGSDREFVRGDILLSETEARDIRALAQKYDKFILVLNVGGPVDLAPVSNVKNILVLSQLGVETGRVLADILLGRAFPSGKLTTTWAAADDYPAVGEFGDRDDTRYREGVYVGYRYFDSAGVRPLYPFGFGLGFTSFSVSAAGMEADGDRIAVRALVKNMGAHPGRETVQLYVTPPDGAIDKPYQSLAAFEKTEELGPGAETGVTLRFALSDLASFDGKRGAYVLEPGDYVLRLGTSSRDTAVCGALRLDAEAVTLRVRRACGTPDFNDWIPEQAARGPLPEDCPVVCVAAASLPHEEAPAAPAGRIEPAVAALSDKQLIYMNIGAFDPKAGLMSFIGNASQSVAGAAGETTRMLRAAGIPPLVMADGPAGLRLSRDYAIDENGVYALGVTMPESMAKLLPKGAGLLMKMTAKKPKKGAAVQHQYATAIPIGTALAQSWDPAFAQLCGDIVGGEMERFGVHLWLAPALNIHRSIRCGRNFEYFSEDPLLSGLMAAALTRGVQAHPGRGVTIKHYAANNQERNRCNNNSQVSERAMREIYLRGFGICVRKAQPHALMTSYNLLNGTHTSERRDLIEDVLRGEFGFEGIVMTDWIVNGGTLDKTSVHPGPNGARIAAAGGDLVMPGCAGDYKAIETALRRGTLRRRQLEINASRVYRMVKKLTGV